MPPLCPSFHVSCLRYSGGNLPGFMCMTAAAPFQSTSLLSLSRRSQMSLSRWSLLSLSRWLLQSLSRLSTFAPLSFPSVLLNPKFFMLRCAYAGGVRTRFVAFALANLSSRTRVALRAESTPSLFGVIIKSIAQRTWALTLPF